MLTQREHNRRRNEAAAKLADKLMAWDLAYPGDDDAPVLVTAETWREWMQLAARTVEPFDPNQG